MLLRFTSSWQEIAFSLIFLIIFSGPVAGQSSGPTLGRYFPGRVLLGEDLILIPDAPPQDVDELSVLIRARYFSGIVTSDPTSGVIRLSNVGPSNIIPIFITIRRLSDSATVIKNPYVLVELPSCGSGNFSPASPLITSGQPYELKVADLNSDGIRDVVTTNLGGTDLSIFYGNGSGGFQAPVSLAVGPAAESLAVDDFNVDGHMDLVITRHIDETGGSDGGQLEVYLSDGAGAFSLASRTIVGVSPSSVLTHDFNRDGKLDVAYTQAGIRGRSVAGLFILSGDGMGGFEAAPPPLAGSRNADYLCLGDYNEDGIADLATAGQRQDQLGIFLGDGSGNFTAGPGVALTEGSLWIDQADMNGDGYKDLIRAARGVDQVVIYYGDGSGSFGRPQDFNVPDAPIHVSANDFNGDGQVDIAVAQRDGNSVSLLLSEASGGWQLGAPVSVGAWPASMAGSDFNGDGVLDLAVANFNENSISILLGEACSTGPAPGPDPGPGPASANRFMQDLQLAQSICQCSGELSPYLVESALNNGYSVEDLLGLQASIPSLRAGGVSFQELRDAGVTIVELFENGVLVSELVGQGISIQDILDEDPPMTTMLSAGMPVADLYGKTYRGGLIFYVDAATGTGLVAAAADLGIPAAGGGTDYELPWSCTLGRRTRTYQDIESGESNTEILLRSCSDPQAVVQLVDQYDHEGYSDWFLPSVFEMQQMYERLGRTGVGNFSTDNYWGSTFMPIRRAIVGQFRNLSDGSEVAVGLNQSISSFRFRVRPVRAF